MCELCGKPAENGRPSHHLGCPMLGDPNNPPEEELPPRCAMDGCTNLLEPDAGPRTKYCPEHKTTTRKKG